MPTLRHLLTHTSGIGYWRRLSDLLRPGVGSGDVVRGPVLPLAEYYRDGLPVEVEPGTKWAYSNHGIGTAGQIVADVTGEPIEAYLRDHVLDPLGMDETTFERCDEPRSSLATGYGLHANGLRPVTPHDVPLAAAGGAISTTSDLARYLIALLNGGHGERAPVLKPETLATMFEPHHRPDPRIPGYGLGFMLGDEDGHRTAGHDGILSGFLSAISLAPDDGLGVIVLTNTGRLDARGVAAPLAAALQRRLLHLPDDPLRYDVPQHPEVWGELQGWYGLDRGPVTNLFTRILMGAGVEVRVRRDHLMLQPLTPLPPMVHGLRLYPDDPDDPYVFRIDFSPMGQPTMRVAFAADPSGSRPLRVLMDGMSFEKRPDSRNPRRWARGVTAGAATAVAIRRRRRRAGSP